jgi:hypothetical protein
MTRLLRDPLPAGLCFIFLAIACSDDEEKRRTAGTDAGRDAEGGVAVLEHPECQAPDAENHRIVPIDLDAILAQSGGSGAVAKVVDDAADLIGGEAAQGQICDFALSNESVRFIVQGPDRTVGAGPFGGNLLDGDIVRADGSGQDVIGEISPFIQLGRTFDARRVDILRDGSDGGPAVIAATGPDEVLDYIDVAAVIGGFVGSPVELPVSADEDLPITVTNYFILEPGNRALRQITAIRNDGPAELVLSVGDLIDSGGSVEFFNPISTLNGFGYSTATPELLDLLAFRGPESSYVYGPALKDGQPAAAYMVFAGVAGVLVGPTQSADALGTLFAPELTRDSPGVLVVPAGEVRTYERWLSVGDGSLATATAPVRRARGTAMGVVEGRVVDTSGSTVAGARVSAVDAAGRAETQFVADGEGAFAGELAEGTYSFEATTDGRLLVTAGTADVTTGQVARPETTMSAESAVRLHIESPSGTPLPAKVTFICAADCPEGRRSQLRDVNFDEPGGDVIPDGPGGEIFRIEFVDHSGERTIPIPPGSYRAVVSRGMTYSVFPTDFPTSGGVLVELAPGQTGSIDATLARVVDTSGYLGADFHVHAVNSPDSPVANRDRLITFLGEGVDVMVSSDHDFVTDFSPVVSALGAEAYVATMVGVELTTFTYGHFNAFPIARNEESINGGAFDWAGGTGPNVHPDVFLNALEHDHPGEQVVQVNHPDDSSQGYFAAIGLDVSTGATLADPAVHRLETPAGATSTDTKLFSGAFTAVEIMNGLGLSSFHANLNFWLGFLNRGIVKTATAVSDTHAQRNSQAGMPRSFVDVGSGRDTIATLDQAAFVTAVNTHRLFGSNGPFLRFSADHEGTVTPMGGTVTSASGDTVTLTVEVQTPSWFKANRVELYSNVTETVPGPGAVSSTPPTPVDAVDFVLDDATDLVDGAEGGAAYRRYRRTVTFTVAPAADSYYVVMVRGSDSLFPATTNLGAAPLAFSNPIFVDLNGGGFGGL